jgi:hypothetical protein
MRQQNHLSIISLLFRLVSILILSIPLWWTPPNVRSAQNLPYALEQVNVGGTIEYRFKFNDHHFMTLIDENGTFIFRPHPGCDINGWGSSWYAQPFLPGAELKHTSIISATANAEGIHVIASGAVSRDISATYGAWSAALDFSYDPGGKIIRGTGAYTIALEGQLSDLTGDLNLFRIASNYLDNVPLLTGQIGDTGDMQAANVIGDNFHFTWIPPDQPSHFPTNKTDVLSIDVIGNFNNVDTVTMGFVRIAPAFKPSLKVVLTSKQPGTGMIFGGIYDVAKSQQFWEDNVGITPLIQRTSTQTAFDFDVMFESKASDCTYYLPVIMKF